MHRRGRPVAMSANNSKYMFTEVLGPNKLPDLIDFLMYSKVLDKQNNPVIIITTRINSKKNWTNHLILFKIPDDVEKAVVNFIRNI